MSARRPYMRPMAGWWRKNPYFVEYMVHEGTAFFVALYAVILLTGIMRLAEGIAAWDAWVAWLESPLSLAIHSVLLIAFLYHTWTWFNIMPRTLPPIVIGGKRLTATTITRAGLASACLTSIVLFIICWSLAK